MWIEQFKVIVLGHFIRSLLIVGLLILTLMDVNSALGLLIFVIITDSSMHLYSLRNNLKPRQMKLSITGTLIVLSVLLTTMHSSWFNYVLYYYIALYTLITFIYYKLYYHGGDYFTFKLFYFVTNDWTSTTGGLFKFYDEDEDQ